MRLLCAAAAAMIAPAAACGAEYRLQFNVDRVELMPAEHDRVVHLDVYLVDLDDVYERLTSVTVPVRGPANTAGGVRFALGGDSLPLPSNAHPDAFRAYSSPPAAFAWDHAMVHAFAGASQAFDFGVNITEANNGLFALPVLVPGGAAPGVYPVVIEPTLILLEETSALDAVPVTGPPRRRHGGARAGGGLSLLTAAALAAPALLRRRPGGKGCEHIASRRGAGRRDVVNALAAR